MPLSVRTPTQHRAAVAAIMATVPANDSEIYKPKACPTLSRLRAANDPRAALLLRWVDLTAPLSMPMGLDAANDNDDVLDPEHSVEIIPSPERLVDAAFADPDNSVRRHFACRVGRVSFTRHRARRGVWNDVTETVRPIFRDGEARLGDLRVRDGELASWAHNRHGRPVPPKERRRPTGPAKARRSAGDIASYLALAGSGVIATDAKATGPVGLGAVASPHKRAAQLLLRKLGVDGSVPFDLAAPKARRAVHGGTVVPGWALFRGGVTHTAPGRTSGDFGAAHDEMMRAVSAERIRAALGHRADVLDAAVSDMSAREIGEQFGRRGKAAERAAVRMIDDALAHFEKIAA